MDQASPVRLAERCRQTDANAQEASQIDRVSLVLLDYPIQRFAARILKNEDRLSLVTSQFERLSRPCRIEFGRQRVFMFEPPETLRRGLFSSDRHRQDRHLIAGHCTAVKSEVRSLAKRLQ